MFMMFVRDTIHEFQALRGASPGTEQFFLLPGALMDRETGKQKEA